MKREKFFAIEKKKVPRFYEFSQTNSGGLFIINTNLCHRIVIEALSEEDAICKAEDLGCYWNGCDKGIDCPCCGDQWYKSPSVFDIEEYKKKRISSWVL